MKTKPEFGGAHKNYDITTDGRTVWVNGSSCLARFCPSSGEVFGEGMVYSSRSPDWKWWKSSVLKLKRIRVPDKFKPKWFKEDFEERKNKNENKI